MHPINAIRSLFPNLSSEAEITSPETPQYNCIAYAAGDQTRWWWPDAMNKAYWPPNCLRQATLPAFQMAFETLGFQVCSEGMVDSEKYDMIAIFHSNSKPTHAAIRLDNGKWSRKLGKSFDISHQRDCLNGEEYGEVAFFMCRQKNRSSLT